MLSGRRLDLLDPSPLDLELEDIAHGLARVARWNGQTQGAHIFSVAQHALLVETLARAQVPRLDRYGRLAVLLHDAPEYVIGDMISPFKAVIGDSYKAVEKRLLAAIHLRFGLPAKLPETLQNLIKAADRSAAAQEREKLDGQISTVMVMDEMPKPRDCYVLVRGQYDKHGGTVTAGLPAAFPPLPGKSLMIPSEEVAKNRKAWIDEWLAAMSQ